MKRQNTSMVVHWKNIATYGGILVMLGLYSIFLDIRFGFLFFVPALLLPIFSYSWVHGALNHAEIIVDIEKETLYKGESLSLTAQVLLNRKRPVPFLSLVFYSEGNFTNTGEDTLLFSMKGNNQFVAKKQYTAHRWGQAQVGIKEVKAEDFLGLFSVTLNQMYLANHCGKQVLIYPDIGPLHQGELLQEIQQAMDTSDDQGTEENIQVNLFNEPGYSYREYVAGDPFKRVNWKLSARLNKMVVREYEKASVKRPLFILDKKGGQPLTPEGLPRLDTMEQEERTVEALLGILLSMVHQGIACGVWVCFGTIWQEIHVETAEDVFALRHQFGNYAFSHEFAEGMPASRLPREKLEQTSGRGVFVLFTSLPDEELGETLEATGHNTPETHIITPAVESADLGTLWQVTTEFEYLKI